MEEHAAAVLVEFCALNFFFSFMWCSHRVLYRALPPHFLVCLIVPLWNVRL
jgi:hypothetical protein